jgi:hypothetical protein
MNSTTNPREKLEQSQERTRFLQVAQMRPDLAPGLRESLKQLEVSQKAVTKLRQKALTWEQSQSQESPLQPQDQPKL